MTEGFLWVGAWGLMLPVKKVMLSVSCVHKGLNKWKQACVREAKAPFRLMLSSWWLGVGNSVGFSSPILYLGENPIVFHPFSPLNSLIPTKRFGF